jgi:hypothetical protein
MSFKDPYGSTPPVIVIEPTRSNGGYSISPGPGPGPTQPRAAEINAETATSGKGFSQWVRDEAAWGLAHFFRALFTVVVYRGFYHLFTKGIANQQAYDQAPDLWTKGKKESGFRRGSGGYYQSRPGNGATAGFSAFRPTSRMADDPPWWTTARSAADATQPRGTENLSGADMRKLGRVGPYTVYDNRTVLDRATQFWACKLLYRTPCENCRFMVADQSGTNHCAAELKAKMLREERDDGRDIEEIREAIRREA